MAIGKTAGGLILALAAVASAAQFPVRHEHVRKSCAGILTVDENGVSFAGPKKHVWTWKYQDIQELRLSPDGISVRSYKDRKLWLGADAEYDFKGPVPAVELYAMLKDRMDQRLVAEIGRTPEAGAWTVPVKHLGHITGSEGTLAFGAESIEYVTPSKEQSRTWRYSDIDSISSSGRFQLSITTLEKGFNFQLKQALPEAKYNDLWLQIEKKNGRIQ